MSLLALRAGLGTGKILAAAANNTLSAPTTVYADTISVPVFVTAGDHFIIDAWFTYNQSSGSNLLLTFGADIGGFTNDLTQASGANATHATRRGSMHVHATFAIGSSSLLSITTWLAATGALDDGAFGTISGRSSWRADTSDYTGSQTIKLKVKSDSGNANQNLRLVAYTLRRIRPT